jgi:hypothetical protein
VETAISTENEVDRKTEAAVGARTRPIVSPATWAAVGRAIEFTLGFEKTAVGEWMKTSGAIISPNVEPIGGASRSAMGITMGEMGPVETGGPVGAVGPRMGMEAMGYSNCISSVSELVCKLIYEENEVIYTWGRWVIDTPESPGLDLTLIY